MLLTAYELVCCICDRYLLNRRRCADLVYLVRSCQQCIGMNRTFSLATLSYVNPIQSISAENIDRYENGICGPNEILTENFFYEVTSNGKIQIYNFLNRNKDSNLLDAVKWAVNLNRPNETENISFKDSAENDFKIVTKKRKKGNSRNSKPYKIISTAISSNDSDMEPDNVEANSKTRVGKRPKPIMVSGVANIIDFTRHMFSDEKFEFKGRLSGKHVKILRASLRDKMLIIDHLKQQNVQFTLSQIGKYH